MNLIISFCNLQNSIFLKSIDSMIKMINGIVEVIEFQMTWLELKDYGGGICRFQ